MELERLDFNNNTTLGFLMPNIYMEGCVWFRSNGIILDEKY
jgi:hypothetical protein